MTLEQKKKAERITDFLYDVFGTGTGHLFGISPKWRSSVEVIVGLTIQYSEEFKEED